MTLRLIAATATLVLATNVQAADLVDTAAAAGNLKIFVAAVKAAGFAESLRSDGPFTVFAPSDEAFARLPAGTWATLVKDKAKLAQVLTHQVIPGRIMVAEVKPGKTRTLEGGFLALKSDNGRVTVDDATVIESDMVADNGVIHAVDTVVMPK
ncbi:MAG: fasciclin domain-containing protein [Herminiimonas sp.]|nr:fasciclin domain-containing protein [Herminiimonas sp.]